MSHEPFELFMAVFETGSFSAAAKKCHKSPSAISKQIAALETQYGATFFDRTTRRVHATEAGRVYYAHCKTMHLAHRDVSKELESLSGKPAGDIRITWPAGLAFSHLTENMGQFAALYPDIRFDVMATNDVVNMKEEGIDIAFRTSPKNSSELIGIELFKVSPLICATPDFVARFGPFEKLTDLAGVPNVLPSYMNLVQKTRPSFPEMAQLKWEEQHRVNDIGGMLNLCRAGLGASFLFEHIIADDLESGRLVRILPNLPIPPLSVYMLHHQRQFAPQRVRAFIDFMKSQYLYPHEAAPAPHDETVD